MDRFFWLMVVTVLCSTTGCGRVTPQAVKQFGKAVGAAKSAAPNSAKSVGRNAQGNGDKWGHHVIDVGKTGYDMYKKMNGDPKKEK